MDDWEYRVVTKAGFEVATAKPVRDADIAEAGRVWNDYAVPGYGPHQVERRPLRDSGWTRVPRSKP